MIGPLKNHLALIQKLCIALLLAWSVGMLVLFWFSGTEETRVALATGKRFIVHTESSEIEGFGVPAMPEPAAPEAVPEAVLPPVENDPKQADASAVTAVTTSSNPIADISEELLEKIGGVSLPRISETGIKPSGYYAKSFRRQNEFPLIAIIITGLGQSKKTTDLALALDDRITLSFSPYAAAAGSWAAASRLTGHELYMDMPMQTADFPDTDPGPYSILLTRSNTENLKNLHWALSRFQGYAGVVAPIGEVVTGNADSFTPLAKDLAHRGLILAVGHMQSQQQETEEGAKKPDYDLTTTYTDVWIDEELTEMSIQARLATLEQMAQRNGFAVGVAQAYPLSIKEIAHWQRTMGERGVMLAPLSFIPKLKR